MIIWVVKISFYSSSVFSCHLFLISSASVRSRKFLSFIEPIVACNVPLVSLVFLKRSLVFPILFFSSISLHWLLKKAFFYLFLLFFGTLHSDASIFPFLLCFSLLIFSQLFVRPSPDSHCVLGVAKGINDLPYVHNSGTFSICYLTWWKRLCRCDEVKNSEIEIIWIIW